MFELLPRVYQHVRCYKFNCFNDTLSQIGVLCLVTWCLAISDRHAPRHWAQHAHLRQRIIEAVEFITPHMLINTWQELEYRLDICRATTGAYIEVYGCA